MEDKVKNAFKYYRENCRYHDPLDVKKLKAILIKECNINLNKSQIIDFWTWHSNNSSATWVKPTSNEEVIKSFNDFLNLSSTKDPDKTVSFKYLPFYFEIEEECEY